MNKVLFSLFLFIFFYNLKCRDIDYTNHSFNISSFSKIEPSLETKLKCNVIFYINNNITGFYGRFTERYYNICFTDVYMNKDSNRLVAMCIISYKSKDTLADYSHVKDSFLYDSRSLIGYKENGNWKFYPFDRYIGVGFETFNEARFELKFFLENTLAKRSIIVYDDLDEDLGEIKYAVTNNKFWTESPFWFKSVKNSKYYYYFELNDNGTINEIPETNCK